jgi:hypothetical protein
MLQKVENAVIQTDEDLSKKFELLPKLKPKKITFDSEHLAVALKEQEVDEKSIKAIMDKPKSKGFEALPRKYLPFPDNKFGI